MEFPGRWGTCNSNNAGGITGVAVGVGVEGAASVDNTGSIVGIALAVAAVSVSVGSVGGVGDIVDVGVDDVVCVSGEV